MALKKNVSRTPGGFACSEMLPARSARGRRRRLLQAPLIFYTSAHELDLCEEVLWDNNPRLFICKTLSDSQSKGAIEC
jgi:hypothetical protein